MKLFYALVAPVAIVTGVLLAEGICLFYQLTYWDKIAKAASVK